MKTDERDKNIEEVAGCEVDDELGGIDLHWNRGFVFSHHVVVDDEGRRDY